MLDYSEPVAKLIDEFKRLPGVGHKSAQRLAFYILRRPEEDIDVQALHGLFVIGQAADAQLHVRVEGRQRLGQVADQLRSHAPKVARLLEDAEADLLAFYGFPWLLCQAAAA